MRPGYDAAAVTDRGVRARNEDAFVCGPSHSLLAVIDGMGGQAAGDRAASIAALEIGKASDPVEALVQANLSILGAVAGDPALVGMGCAATVVRIRDRSLLVAHIGDTMAYLHTRVGFEALTRRHTRAAEVQRTLALDDRETENEGGANELLNDLGRPQPPGRAWMDVSEEIPLEEGDLVVLCSDGVHGVLSMSDLSKVVKDTRDHGGDVEPLAKRLVQLALERGSRDNVTVVVARVGGSRAEAPAAPISEARPLAGTRWGPLVLALALGTAFGGVLGYWAGARAQVEVPEQVGTCDANDVGGGVPAALAWPVPSGTGDDAERAPVNEEDR